MLLEFKNNFFLSRFRDFSDKDALRREIFVWEIWKRWDPLLTLDALLAFSIETKHDVGLMNMETQP